MQEEQDDQHGEHRTDSGGVFERVDGRLNETTLLEGDVEIHGRIFLMDYRGLGVHAVGSRDDVGIGLRRDGESDCRQAIDAREDALVFDRIADVCHIAQVDGRAVFDGDDRSADLGCRFVQRARADAELVGSDRDDAGGIVDVFVRDFADDVVVGQSVAGDLRLIRRNHDGARLAAGNRRASDSRHCGKLIGEDVREEVVEIAL